MGNRALIITEKPTLGKPVPAVYVHWNGGIESVKAIADVCRERNYRSPSHDPSYALARFLGVYHEYFGILESTSLGIIMFDGEKESVEFDNGVYVLGKDWEVEEHWVRKYTEPDENGEQTFAIVKGETEVSADQIGRYNSLKKYLIKQGKVVQAMTNELMANEMTESE